MRTQLLAISDAKIKSMLTVVFVLYMLENTLKRCSFTCDVRSCNFQSLSAPVLQVLSQKMTFLFYQGPEYCVFHPTPTCRDLHYCTYMSRLNQNVDVQSLSSYWSEARHRVINYVELQFHFVDIRDSLSSKTTTM